MARTSTLSAIKKLFTRPVAPRTPDRRARLGAESLEARVVPAVSAYVDVASRLLVVNGTSGNDVIVVNHDAAGVHVRTGSAVLSAHVAVARSVPHLPITLNGTKVTGVSAAALQTAGNGYAVVVHGHGGHDIVSMDPSFPLRAWLTGGDGNDALYGSAAADWVDGGAGNDTIYSQGGNDVIFAGSGDDYASGGDGNDSLYGDVGNDSLYGDAGNDLMYGGAGDDDLDGGTGNDTIYGRGGNDRIYGRAGDDTAYGEDGNDTVDGNEGADVLNVGAGDDYASGGAGNDSMFGDVGNDYMYGEDGNDLIYGGAGIDLIDGGAGNDSLYGRAGNDSLYGRAGNDTLYGEDGRDKLYGHEGIDKLYGGADDDYLHGGAGSDTIEGGSGTDTFRRNLYFPGLSLIDREEERSDEPVMVTGAFLTELADGARPSDVDQTGSPTCSILAALASVSAKTDLESKIRYNPSSDTYTIDIFVGGTKRAITVNADWTEGRDPGKALWVTLYQKAYLSALGVSSRGSVGELLDDAKWSYANTDYRKSSVALHALTGLTTVYTAITSATPQTLQATLAGTSLRGIIASSKDAGTKLGVASDHAYRVVSCSQSGGVWYVKLQNPWGRDGTGASTDGTDDGFLTLTWNAFKANFDGYTRAGG